jgi:hypothetical protein
MRAKARGGWVAGAIRSMVQPNRRAAAILHAYGCTACTDVTGFGLLGHLIEMIQYGDSAHALPSAGSSSGTGAGAGAVSGSFEDDTDEEERRLDYEASLVGVDPIVAQGPSETEATAPTPAQSQTQTPVVPACDLAVELYLDSVPVLPGARECVQLGILSSLQPQVLLHPLCIFNHLFFCMMMLQCLIFISIACLFQLSFAGFFFD